MTTEQASPIPTVIKMYAKITPSASQCPDPQLKWNVDCLTFSKYLHLAKNRIHGMATQFIMNMFSLSDFFQDVDDSAISADMGYITCLFDQPPKLVLTLSDMGLFTTIYTQWFKPNRILLKIQDHDRQVNSRCHRSQKWTTEEKIMIKFIVHKVKSAVIFISVSLS